MVGKVFAGIVLCGVAFVTGARAQQVDIPRERNTKSAQPPKRVATQPKVEIHSAQTVALQSAPLPLPKLTIEQMRQAGAAAAQRVKEEMHDIESDAAPSKVALTTRKPSTSVASRSPVRSPEPLPLPPVSLSSQSAFIKLADGFDLPVGKSDGQGYYKARGFQSQGHLGEDWDGIGGGDTDLGDPVYCIGDGVVVFARDCHLGWGNVVIVRHAYRDGYAIRNIDSLYGHLQKILVRPGQTVRRGQQIAAIGNAHGLYDAHLHLEIRKNLEIGMSRDKFAKDLSNYYDPSQFILSHRHLQGAGGTRVAMNTFVYDSQIQWDKLRNYSHAHTGGGSSQSAYALKKALSSQGANAR
jgi:murein DD-endopeptidase MepM/ murein hydrolase activator NlpD